MRETAYAKINLALHVRERMPDGYHRIETVFAFAEDGDTLEAGESDRLELRLAGPFAGQVPPGSDNLVFRAAQALREAFAPGRGALLRLDKRLPVASGIGGGSADAAAALRLLPRLWGLDADEAALGAIAAGLGADVPACLASAPARGEGRGDQLEPLALPELAGAPLLLVNPGVPLSTAAVFAAWDGLDRGPLEDWERGRNDLEPAARRLAPAIGDALEALSGAGHARMSGSGATCFGIYPDEKSRDEAEARIRKARRDWWLLATRLRGAPNSGSGRARIGAKGGPC